MMLALLLVAAGIALVCGSSAKGVAGQLIKGFVGGVLLLTGISFLTRSCVCSLHGEGADGLASVLGDLSGLAILAVLAIIGFIAWRRKTERARASELWAKRNGTPRARSLPSPPPP
jgi:hypothetical protein